MAAEKGKWIVYVFKHLLLKEANHTVKIHKIMYINWDIFKISKNMLNSWLCRRGKAGNSKCPLLQLAYLKKHSLNRVIENMYALWPSMRKKC